LKTNHDKVRLPAYMRSARGEDHSDQDRSVGDVLRIARKRLIIRQLVIFLLFLIIAAALVFFVVFGYFDYALDFLSDRLLG